MKNVHIERVFDKNLEYFQSLPACHSIFNAYEGDHY
jgi:hypothetical protein